MRDFRGFLSEIESGEGYTLLKLLILILLATAALGAGDPYEVAIKPFLRDNCAPCHNSKFASGDLNIEKLAEVDAATSLKEREHWENIARRMRAGEMPPKGGKVLTEVQISKVANWVETEYARMDRELSGDPGHATAHRLNRFEYNNTIRDLLGIDFRPADDFPADPYGYGFDNIGDALSISPMLTEKYLKAAEHLAALAIPDEQHPLLSTVQRYLAERMGQAGRLRISVDAEFPVEGEYSLRSGWYQILKPGIKMDTRFLVDGKPVSSEELTFFTEMDRSFYARNVRIGAGKHQVEAVMEVDPLWKGAKPYLEYIEIKGPDKQFAPEHAFVTGKDPRPILETLATRAYRRPVTAGELAQLVALVKSAQHRGDSYSRAMRLALEAVLINPNFLFRIERDSADGAAHPVSDFDLASRLSYLLWSSMPDDELLKSAIAGELHKPEVLQSQVARMMADTKSQAFVRNFGGQWLQTRNLDVLKPDAAKFPDYGPELREDMRTETEMFFEEIVKEDRSILDFIDGDFTFLNERLARHYGIEGVTGPEFRRVKLDGAQRSGVLTQASVLTVSSYPTRTSPVIRGKWILENILNTPPPPPPPDVPALDEKTLGQSASMRQQLEQHRANPACAGCHARMDPLGFGLENYDAIGRWRTQDGSFPVDSSGTLPNGKSFAGAAELKAILKADPNAFAKALTEKMLTYALGRGLEAYDRPAVQQIVQRTAQNGYRFSALVQGIVASMPFQERRAAVESAQAVSH